MRWAPDPAALELLERAGPFETMAYRSACVATLSDTADASFGAVSDGGASAAVALIRQGLTAHLPYGYSGVRASQRLSIEEVRSFLHTARQAAGAQRLIVHDVLDAAAGGRTIATTSIAYLDAPPAERFAKKARQSIRRAVRAGATCASTADPETFVGLYETASKAWGMTYPIGLISATAERGLAMFFDVHVDGRRAGSIAVLRGATHWMYWLAAQNDVGRRAEVGYLAVASMLEEARAAGAGSVNLGASAGLPGVAEFKKRVGGVERPVLEWRDASPLMTAASPVMTLAERSYAALTRWRRT